MPPTKRLSQAAIVDTIREAILSGKVVPGQRLVEAELCESLNSTRGSVRAALIDLEHEGLVERIANRGARVRVVTLEEALQIAEVRMVVESLCVGRAAERITDADISRLRAVAERMKVCAERGDVNGFAELTHSTFETYVRIADHPVATEVLVRLRARNVRHGFRLTYRADRARVALPFWLDIIDAICRRDSKAAPRAIRRHALNVQESMKALADELTLFAK